MSFLYKKITTLTGNEELLRDRRYGMIEVIDQELNAIYLRPWPKMISVAEANWAGGWQHGRFGKKRPAKNRCQIYYNQPLGHSGFLALKYIVTTFGTTSATGLRALVILDEIARLKRINAIVGEVTNQRISDRFMQRQGWERHLESSRHRHFIKRFYGEYPDHSTKRILQGIAAREPALPPLKSLAE
jgi:hypothetical protein